MSVLRAFRQPELGVGAGSFPLFTVTQEPFPHTLLIHLYQAELIRKERSDSQVVLLLSPCVASSCCGSVSPHKITISTPLPPRGVGRRKMATAMKCKVITNICPERLSALARRLLSDMVLRAFPVAALSDGARSVLLWHRCLWAQKVEPHTNYFLPWRDKINPFHHVSPFLPREGGKGNLCYLGHAEGNGAGACALLCVSPLTGRSWEAILGAILGGSVPPSSTKATSRCGNMLSNPTPHQFLLQALPCL